MDATQTQRLTLREAADQLGVSVKTVRRYVTSGRLPGVQVVGRYGTEWTVDADDVASYSGQDRPGVGKGPTPTRSRSGKGSMSTDLTVVVQALVERQAADAASLERAWTRVAELERDLATARTQLAAGPTGPRSLSLKERLTGRTQG